MSVRFLGRRVHLALAVVLVSDRGPTSAAARRLAEQMSVSARTVARWREWWRERFPATALWQAMCARFMPPVAAAGLPTALLVHFAVLAGDPMHRLLMFLTPLTGSAPIKLREGR